MTLTSVGSGPGILSTSVLAADISALTLTNQRTARPGAPTPTRSLVERDKAQRSRFATLPYAQIIGEFDS